ncbi:DUF305 domain-containing protein [Saccharomonospora iraqiensis]|uniref:DUF305 domain-containing protein n=1 Tax=Saccharomonospora iraqiensis TaxID=52698 RepID=UPI00048ECB9D|nr:DUF305 domain-containing protein [Saccharomonospora iraqiensis]
MRGASRAGMPFLAVVVAVGLAGCTGDAGTGADAGGTAPGVIVPGGPGESARTVEPGSATGQRQLVEVTEADIRYMRMMIPHHEQAVTMTDLVPDRVHDDAVASLAERIAVTQAGEIDAMQAWLDRNAPEGGDGQDHAHGRMPGMATPEQLDALRAAEGAEFDRLFLELMITHHEGALTMAENYLPDGVEPNALHMAQEVITTQTAEIETMNGMLDG